MQHSLKNWTTRLFLIIAIVLVTLVLTREEILGLGILDRLELASIDYRFKARGTHPTIRDSSHIVIIELSDESFKSVPERWPWPRSYYARLIRNLRDAGARVVAIDIILSGKDAHAERNDDSLRAAIRETGIVVLAGKAAEGQAAYTRITSDEDYGNHFFNVDSSLGVVNVYNDADGVLRRYCPVFATEGDRLIPSFSFAVLNKYFHLPPLSIVTFEETHFELAGRRFPKYDDRTMLINFYGPSGTFRRVKFADVLDDDTFTTNEEQETGQPINTFSDRDYGYKYDGTFAGKIVLVGSTMPEDHDLFPVSMARGRQEGDNMMYGVELHANVIENVLRGDFIRRQSLISEIVCVLLPAIITFVVIFWIKAIGTRHHLLVEITGLAFVAFEVVVIAAAGVILFNQFQYLVNLVPLMVAVLGTYSATAVYHFVNERKQRMLIKSMFSTYVNPSVVDELVANPEKLKLGGERKEMTVMFSDIHGFTSISENMPPEELVGLLNEYLNTMTEVIFKYNGTLDKYEGDAIMAFWGAPIAQHDHALRACLAALEMQDKLTDMRERWQREDKPLFHVRVGINSGEMVVGNMGGAGKFDYTVIGDSVNLASRLEGANKIYGTKTLVSQQTYDMVKERIIGRELDLITVRGRKEPITIYELMQTRDSTIDPTLQLFLDMYAAGLQLYRDRDWTRAMEKFEEALVLRPNDPSAGLHIERASYYKIVPPPDDWNGVADVAEV